jgi:hypothetical protein
MRRGRWAIAGITVLLVVVAGIAVAWVVDDTDPGRLVMGDDVPDDLRVLATGVFDAFEERFDARLGCMSDVRLVPAWEGLDDRARYLPGSRVIELRVPATANLLEGSLVHELAHHLEATCADHEDLRPAFLEAQGHSAGTDWFRGDAWENTPSEQFAETVVQVVLGERLHHGLQMPIAGEAVDVVASWGRGEG